MSYRACEGYSDASEEFSPICQSGSALFSQSTEVNNWCQSIPLPEGFPLTPPDTASDCSLTEYQDMAASWTQTSLPGEYWNPAPAVDHGTWTQSSSSGWHGQGVPVTSQDLAALESSTWLNVSEGLVDSGLSPVLSQDSQNSHSFCTTLNSETPLLPPRLDLSFIAEPSWDIPVYVVYRNPQMAPEYPYVTNSLPSGMFGDHVQEYHSSSSSLCAPQEAMAYFQGDQAPLPKRDVSDPPFIQGRPLLPRTDSQLVPHTENPTDYGLLQSQHTRAGHTDRVASVSTEQGLIPEGAITGSLSTWSSAGQNSPMYPLSHSPETLPLAEPTVREHAIKGFNELVQQDAKLSAVTGSLSEEPPTATSRHDSLGLGKIEQSGPALSQGANSATVNVYGEGDEGRHRSHPLYNEGPQLDGLYHCPFKNDPSCQHKPTKLKCNYDKFIDSHLKPFRCKIEVCSKQEFSSTACLLRHEREAHGMHGHGERPHLCFYPGCERSIPGNGFPRRYNLFDHMKRVHDHKDEPSQAAGPLDPQGSRKASGRKRKASASVSEEPAAQRPKLQPVQQPSPSLSLPPNGRPPHGPLFPDLHSRGSQNIQHSPQEPYSEWATQGERYWSSR